MAVIRQDGNAQVRDNFTEVELRSGSWNAPDQWVMSDNTLDALQRLREWSGEPMVITSTLRTPEHNALLSASPTSKHLTGQAIDFKWADPEVHDEMVRKLRNGVVCGGVDGIIWVELYNRLGNKGGGFGWYETFLHIDDRGGEGDDPIMWDLSNNKYDQYDMNTQFYADALATDDYCQGAPQRGKKKSGLIRVLESIFGGGKFSEDGALSFIDRLATYLMLIALGITATIIYKKTKK